MGASKNPGEKTNDDHAEATVDDLEGEGFFRFNYSDDINETNFLEFESVSAEIDNLNGILDAMESNVDNIKDQLMSILESNREILKELKEENQKSADGNEAEVDPVEKPMDTS